VVPAAGERGAFDVRVGEGADGGEGEPGELETPCGGEVGPDGWGERGEEFVVFAVAEGLVDGGVAVAGDRVGEEEPAGAAGGGEAREILGETVAEVHHGGGWAVGGEPLGFGEAGFEVEVMAVDGAAEAAGDGDDVGGLACGAEDEVRWGDCAEEGDGDDGWGSFGEGGGFAAGDAGAGAACGVAETSVEPEQP